MPPISFPRSLRANDWDWLLLRVNDQKCIPCLGSDFTPSTLQTLTDQWSNSYAYLLGEGSHDLARVSQYLAMTSDASVAKEEICRKLLAAPPPDFDDPNEPHAILAELPMLAYLTTNYDLRMRLALKSRRSRDKRPELAVCAWSRGIPAAASTLRRDYKPHVANPLVYHLHGCIDVPDSLVVSEDDYMNFLTSFLEDEHRQQNRTADADKAEAEVIDYRVRQMLGSSSLLLLGYRLSDWDFRVLLRVLKAFLKVNDKRHIAVQLPKFADTATPEQREAAVGYLDDYFGTQKVRVYWGTCREFLIELRDRWKALHTGDRQAG